MKKSLTLILAVLTLGILLFVLWITSSPKTEEISTAPVSTAETLPTESPTTSEVQTSSVVDLEASDVSYIEVSVGNNTLHYVSGDENWSLEGYEDYALDQAGLNFKAKTMLQVTALTTIADANLAEYGLDAPSKKATYHLKDGSSIHLSVGNLSLDHTNVYVMLDNEPTTVYVVNSMLDNALIGDIESYRTKELESYESSSLYSVIVGGSEFENIALELSQEQNGYSTSYDLTTDVLSTVANVYSMEQFKTSLPTFKVNNFIADHVTDLSPYGLDNPVLRLTMSYYDVSTAVVDVENHTGSFDIIGEVDYIWGNILDNGEIAFMKVGDSSVYSMDASFLDNLKEAANPFYLASKYILIPHINNVNSIDIAFEDVSYHMTVDEANGTYTLAGQDMTKELFKKLYRNICNITADIELELADTNADAAVTITYTMSDGTTQIATFMPSSNNQYYQSLLDGALPVGVAKTQLNALKDTLKAAAAGEEFNDIY